MRDEDDGVVELLTSQLRELHRAAAGVTVSGEKIAGVTLVMAVPLEATFTLLGSLTLPREELAAKVAEKLEIGAVPVGFVRWQSRGNKKEEVTLASEIAVTFDTLPLPVDAAIPEFGREQVISWTSRILTSAANQMKSIMVPPSQIS